MDRDTANALNDSIMPAFSGGAGGVMGALGFEGIKPFAAVAMIAAGALSGGFVIPWWAMYLGIEDERGRTAMAFVLGMFALPIAKFGQRNFGVAAGLFFKAGLRRIGLDDGEGRTP